MSYLPLVDAANPAEWPGLVDELDRWEAAGRVATLWWRDDDAVTATAQLDALLHLAGEVPIGLAVIPALARPELAAALRDAPQVAVLQHGWQHANHAGLGKKSEYPEDRPGSLVTAEIAAGHARLAALFGARALPLLVPPWNRIASNHLPLLPQSGIAALSTMASPRRGAAMPAPGITTIDAHVDLVAWQGGRGFVGAAAALGGVVDWLRRARLAATAQPVGILTHHLIMDRETAAFIDRLIALTRGHPAARWASVAEFLS